MTDAPVTVPTPAPWRRRVLRLAGSVAILALLLAFIPAGELRTALGSVPGRVWGVALGVYLTLHLLGVVKWHLLVNAAGAGLAPRDTVRCYYYGLFGNIFLPSIVGGDVVRAGLAARLSRSPSGLVLGSLVDRLLDTAGLAAVAGIGILLLPTTLDARSRATFLGVVGVLALVVLGLVAAMTFVPWARGLPFQLRRRLVTPRRAFEALRRRPGRIVVSLLLGMTLQALLVVLNAWIGRAMGIDIAIVVWLFVWPLAKIAAIAPVTQGGIGVREGALVVLFQPFGVPAAAAMATGLVFTAIVMAGGLCGGLLAAVLGRFPRVAGVPAPVEAAGQPRPG